MTPRPEQEQYDAAVATLIMNIVNEGTFGADEVPLLEIRNDEPYCGIYVSQDCLDCLCDTPADAVFFWNPACDRERGPNPMTAPVLPIPFTSIDLAAFLVGDLSFPIHERLGDIGNLNVESLSKIGGVRGVLVRQSLGDAYELAGHALATVGPLDTDSESRAQLLAAQIDDDEGAANNREGVFEPGISREEANARRSRAKASVEALQEKLILLRAEADKKWDAWRKTMVRALFETALPATALAPEQTPADRRKDMAKRHTELARSHHNPTQLLAKELGISTSAVRSHLRKAKADQTKDASSASSSYGQLMAIRK